MSSTELVVGAAATVVVAVFVVALRAVTRRSGAAIPDATVIDGGARWLEGQGRARFVRRADALHRVAVAAAVTGIAIMVVCIVAVVVLGVAHALR